MIADWNGLLPLSGDFVVVEDDEILRPVMQDILSGINAKVVTFGTADDALIITGGSRGIGASAAHHVAQRGMGVILTYNRNRAAADIVVGSIEQAAARLLHSSSMSPT